MKALFVAALAGVNVGIGVYQLSGNSLAAFAFGTATLLSLALLVIFGKD